MIAAPPLSGCPLAKPATQNLRWPSDGKGATIGTTVGIIMDQWGVLPCCINPPVAKVCHRNDANTPIITTRSYPHPRTSPTRWGNHCGPDDRDCHTQPRRTIVAKRVATPLTSGCVPGPDIATVWTCPTPVYTHTAKLCTNNTHSQGHRAVCPHP